MSKSAYAKESLAWLESALRQQRRWEDVGPGFGNDGDASGDDDEAEDGKEAAAANVNACPASSG